MNLVIVLGSPLTDGPRPFWVPERSGIQTSSDVGQCFGKIKEREQSL